MDNLTNNNIGRSCSHDRLARAYDLRGGRVWTIVEEHGSRVVLAHDDCPDDEIGWAANLSDLTNLY